MWTLLFLATTSLAQQLPPLETAALNEALTPLSTWAGVPVRVFNEQARAFPETMVGVRFSVYPPLPVAGEAIIIEGEGIYLSRADLKSMRTGRALAERLSHALAHVRLSHAKRIGQEAGTLNGLAQSVPHYPVEYLAGTWRRFIDESEKEAQPVAAEILAAAPCAPGACALFERVVAAAATLP